MSNTCRHMDNCGPCQDEGEWLREEIARLRALVKEAESVSTDRCLWCVKFVGLGDAHATDCPAFTPDGKVKRDTCAQRTSARRRHP